ncbi:glycosyltransferase family 2 protein [Rhizobium sp. BE258]|uniref:glycosyltransferase family 2 protein n=1 Tax=Rhizobium sp. BE258 TaxID=2817722 RepID=UPI002859572B|nr:glycosyltransferase family 2 protein [Rhizobium sp. BE258]MDR7145318.1 succinoglycan biosynthesis protein ExoW [Rhizobium sp. BE258]
MGDRLATTNAGVSGTRPEHQNERSAIARVAVIIPYFQKQSGILARAVRSVVRQTHPYVDVIIVDDQSPIPASLELEEFSPEDCARIRIVDRANGGPAAARNSGLDAVGCLTRYVAFLDSDDVWDPNHLANALAEMGQHGAACYFGSIDGGEDFTYHVNVDSLAGRQDVSIVSGDPVILKTDNLTDLMLEDWSYLHVSCMVIAGATAKTVRFVPALRHAAEDVLFFADCALVSGCVLLDPRIAARRGDGVNIFHSVTSHDPAFAAQQFSTFLALKILGGRLDDRKPIHLALSRRKEQARQLMLWGILRQIKSGRLAGLAILAKWFGCDPAISRTALRLAFSKTFKTTKS